MVDLNYTTVQIGPALVMKILSPHPPTRWAQSYNPGIVATPGYNNATGCISSLGNLVQFVPLELFYLHVEKLWMDIQWLCESFIRRMIVFHHFMTQPSVRAIPTANMAGSSNFKMKMKTVRTFPCELPL